MSVLRNIRRKVWPDPAVKSWEDAVKTIKLRRRALVFIWIVVPASMVISVTDIFFWRRPRVGIPGLIIELLAIGCLIKLQRMPVFSIELHDKEKED